MNRIIYLILLVLVHQGNCQTCHYSCASCTQPYYNYCVTCAQNYQFQLVQDPTQLDVQFRNGDQATGVCTGKQDYSFNILGIILVAISIIGLLISKGSRLFYIIYTLQNFALLSFLQIAWLPPISYVLYALRYFFIFNIMGESLKQTTWDIRKHSYYRLNSYYHESSILKSLAILGIMNVVVILLLIAIPIFQAIRKSKCPACCRFLLCYNWVLDSFQRGLYLFFFLMIPQTVLSIIIAMYFTQTIDAASIAIISVYALMLIFLFVATYIKKLKIFPNKFIQYQNYLKKIVFPLFIIVPQPNQYVLIIFMLINVVFQLIFDGLLNIYPFKSRMTIYKTLQITIILMAGISFIVDSIVNVSQSTFIAQIFLMIFICLFLVALIVETVLSTKEQFSNKKGRVAAEPIPQKTMNTLTNMNTNVTSKKNLQENNERLQITEQNIISDVIDDEVQHVEEPPKEKKIETATKLKSLKRVPKKFEGDKTDKRKELQKRYGVGNT